MEMFISFFTGKVMLFYGISLIMKEKSNASALNTVPCANASGGRCIRVWEQIRSCLGAETDASGSRGADRNRERGAKHSCSLGRQSEGRIMQRSSRHQHHCVLREISVLFHFA